jgi:hypothetical protein
MNEKEAQAKPGTSSLQRQESGGESQEREQVKKNLRKKIIAIRQGHATGGYCETEQLIGEEKKLHAILSSELEQLKARHGYSPDPKFKHPEIRAVEVELHGLSFKPRLVVAE